MCNNSLDLRERTALACGSGPPNTNVGPSRCHPEFECGIQTRIRGKDLLLAGMTSVIRTGFFATLARRSGLTIFLEGALEKKIFWLIFIGLSLLADVFLPFFWSMAATVPIVMLSWWLVYRSGWLV